MLRITSPSGGNVNNVILNSQIEYNSQHRVVSTIAISGGLSIDEDETPIPTIRPFQPADLDALYAVALATGDAGRDASALHHDPKLIGHIFAAPYALLEPECAFVVEDGEGVGGYIVGTADTRAFDARLEAEWWPGLRSQYADPASKPPAEWTADEMRAHAIHHPRPTPDRIVAPYPSHLHINLLPRLQGRDLGRELIDHFIEALQRMGSRGLHLGCSAANSRALRFYEAYGFSEVERSRHGTVWMAMAFPERPAA